MRNSLKVATTATLTLAVAIGLASCASPASSDSKPSADAKVGETTSATPQTKSVLCEGEGVENGAKVVYATSRTIHAPLEKVWGLTADVESWPDWQKGIVSESKRVDSGELTVGSQWRWVEPGDLVLTSTLRQKVDQKCLRWDSPVTGPDNLSMLSTQVWTFEQVDGGTLVRTQESWSGDADADPATYNKMLQTGLEKWIDDLAAGAAK